MNNELEIDSHLRYKNISELLDMPVVVRVNEFDNEAAEKFAASMSKAHRTAQPVIPILIDSFGGQVYSLLSMVSDIQNSAKPVATIAVGKAMSCGAVLLTCGDDGHRYVDHHSTVMIHDVSSMYWGKNEELKASVKQVDVLQKKIFHLMAKNCGHPKNYFLDLIHEKSHAEWYLDANEAKRHNIANEVGMPHFTVKVSVDMDFG